jgi:hypothetical protein
VEVLVAALAVAAPAAAQPGGPITLAGQVRDRNATGVAGVTVTLSGAQTATATTDDHGRFAFTGLGAGGTYTVTPSAPAFVFSPVSRTLAALAHDEGGAAFVAQTGAFTRYFAEGATSAFFDTRLALLNTTGEPSTATVRFQQPAPTPEITTTVLLGGHQRVTLDPKPLGLPSAEFATVVEATQPLVADRTMSWDVTGYGSHAETSLGQPRLAWFLAEGATHSGFDLFYLVQNPGDTSAALEVRYLLPSPAAPLVKQYTVGPRSRFNIWVNTEDPALAQAEVSAALAVTNGVPVIVERAMYRAVGGQLFGAGHESAGVAAPALQWYFAEGATGPFFDLFFLVANPHGEVSRVEARYLKPDGSVVLRTYDVAPASRFNIWVDLEGPELADTAVAATFRVTNGVPVVIERAMWWGDAHWYEGHNAAGATATGTTWALAEGEDGGPRGSETYLLIGNTAPRAGTARVTLTFEDGAQVSQEYGLPPSSRTNVPVGLEFPEATGKRFGAVVESVGPDPVPLIVERAMYNDAGGVRWAAGTSAMGTLLHPEAAPPAATEATLLPAIAGPVHLPAPATPVLDTVRAAGAEVGPAGGSVVATAANGTTYTLTIPRGALRRPTAITLTPVTALTGLPRPVELVAAVHGAPEGLRFALPAKLTITLPQPPSGVLLGLVLPDDGATFQVVNAAHTAAATLTARVEHFSTVAIPHLTGDLLALLPTGGPQAQALQLAYAANASGLEADVQALLDHLVAWYDTRLDAQLFAAADLSTADDIRLAWLAEFLAWDNMRSATESLFGHVRLGGTPLRGRLTGRASAGRQGAATVLGNGYARWNTSCAAETAYALAARLALADRAARYAVLAEVYLEDLADNQANAVEVDQAVAPDRDAAGIGMTQIPASFCLVETLAVAEPAVAPHATGQLRVTAGTVFGAEPPAFGDGMEVAFQPDPASSGGLQYAATTAAGEAFFPVTADANGLIRYRVCAHYRPPVEAAGWVTLLYRMPGETCRSSVDAVVVSPAQVTLAPGASQQFTVAVQGTSNQAVTWSVTGGGTITPTGTFTSDGTTGTFYVRATSAEDPSAVGLAQVTVGSTPPPPPPPQNYPCVNRTCHYAGTWTDCHSAGCNELPGYYFTSPAVAVSLPQAGAPEIFVVYSCGVFQSNMKGDLAPSGAFTATHRPLSSNSNPPCLGTHTVSGQLGATQLTLRLVPEPGREVTFVGSMVP